MAAASGQGKTMRPAWRALVGELLAVQQGLVRLYDAFTPEASGELRDRLLEFGQDARPRVALLARAAGPGHDGLPAARYEERRVEEQLALDREQADLRWFHRLTALALAEEKEWLLWETLDQVAHNSPDATDALLPIVEAVETNEAWGAGAGTRHRERVRYLRRALEDVALEELGVPRRRQRRLLPRH